MTATVHDQSMEPGRPGHSEQQHQGTEILTVRQLLSGCCRCPRSSFTWRLSNVNAAHACAWSALALAERRR